VNREILGSADLLGLAPQKTVIFVVTSEFQCCGIRKLAARSVRGAAVSVCIIDVK